MTANSLTWTPVVEYRDIRYEHSGTGIAKVTINRPEVRNAFRPQTVRELIDAFARIRDDASVGCVLLTGQGDMAFCAGGDHNVQGPDGGYLDSDGIARLNVLDLQRQIRSLPIPVIALVNGFAIGGGHVLHIVCDMSIASENAIFGQVGPRVGSFDAGFGVGLLARLVGDKKAKEIWFLCRQYSAEEALEMRLVNKVVPLADLEAEGVAVGERDPGHEPHRDPLPQVGVPRRHRRARRAPGVRGQRDRPVLHDRRGARGLDRRSSRSGGPTTASTRGAPDGSAGHSAPVHDPDLDARGPARIRCPPRSPVSWSAWAPRCRPRGALRARHGARLPRWWRCCSRSWPTSPTTCPTSAAAPTRRTGPVRCGSRRRAS